MAFSVLAINAQQDSVVVSNEDWDNLRGIWKLHDGSMPRRLWKKLDYIYVNFDFGHAQAPWLVEREDWYELQELFDEPLVSPSSPTS